jgi:hypothetical protein
VLGVCTADAWWVVVAVDMGEEAVVIAGAVPLVHTGAGLARSAVSRYVGLVVTMHPAIQQSWWGPTTFGLCVVAAICCEEGVDLSLGLHGGARCTGSGGRGCLWIFLDAEVSNGGSCEVEFDVWLLGFDMRQ